MAAAAVGARELFRDCVHCGLCLSACPTYLELGTEADSPRGRVYLMKGLAEGTLGLDADVVRHLDLCLGCRACEPACPSGVRYGELIETARTRTAAAASRTVLDRLRRRAVIAIFPHPQLLRVLLWPLRVFEKLGLLDPLRRVSAAAAMLPRLGAWAPIRELVAASSAGPASSSGARPSPNRRPARVGLLAGCVAQVLFPEVNRATLRVLRRNGRDVVTPRAQGCCGALHLHAGERDAALSCARRNLDVFPDDLEAIVVNAAGCGAMLRQYGELLADDPAYAERARSFSAKVRDIAEFLVALPLAGPSRELAARVTYHDACHLAHAQGVRQAPRELLRRIPGLELAELTESDVCCGSAGSYSLTEPQMAQRLGDRKAAHIVASGADCVAVGNPGCAMQIQAALRRAGSRAAVRHPVELLDQAYRDE